MPFFWKYYTLCRHIWLTISITGHLCSSECSPECQIQELGEFVNGKLRLETCNIQAYITSVNLKVREFIKQIVLCEASPICASSYVFELSYSKDGEATLSGIIWPKCFNSKNLFIIQKIRFFNLIVSQLLKYQNHQPCNTCS